jgi:hypothetical protein
MPKLTEFEAGSIRQLLGKITGVRQAASKRAKVASETPMLSQVGSVMKSSGIEHRAEIVKRILMKGKPLNPAVKTSSAPPTSSHHGAPARRPGKLEIPQMDSSTKISADADLIKASLLMPRVGGLLSGAKMPLSTAKGVVRGAEKRVSPSAMWSGTKGSGARAQFKQEGFTPRSAGHTPGRGQGISAKPAIFSGSAAGAGRPLPSLAPKAPMADPWSHARVAVEDARAILKEAISGGALARAVAGRVSRTKGVPMPQAMIGARRAVAPIGKVAPGAARRGAALDLVGQVQKAAPKQVAKPFSPKMAPGYAPRTVAPPAPPAAPRPGSAAPFVPKMAPGYAQKIIPARVAAEDAREMLKASVSQSFIASRQTGRLAKAMEAAGHSATQVRVRGAAEAASLPKDTIKPKSLTHGLLRSHIQQFSKTVPKPAMMPV